MIRALAAFEVRTALRAPSTWIYLGLYGLLGALWTLAYVGLVPGMDISLGPDKLRVNSPYVQAQVIPLVGLFGLFTVAGLMGRAGARDHFAESQDLILHLPIPRLSYLIGRFLGGWLVVLFVFAAVPLGCWIAVHAGLAPADRIGPESLVTYLQPFCVSLVPNLFAAGAFFFALTALTRRMTAVYVGSAVLLLGWLMATSLTPESGEGSTFYQALCDPSGIFAADRAVRYWTVAEKNQNLIPLAGVLLWNRLIWFGFGLASLVLAYAFFNRPPRRVHRRRAAQLGAPAATDLVYRPIRPQFGAATTRAMLCRIACFEARQVLANRYCLAILTCGVLFMLLRSFEMGTFMGTRALPVTYLVLDQVGRGFSFFILVIATYYAGELVFRERDVRLAQIYDALPVADAVPFLAKTVGLGLLVFALLVVVGVTGIAIQLTRGWTQLNLPLYASELFLVQGSTFLLICVLTLSIQVLINHKQLAHLTMILCFLCDLAAPRLGLDHPLLFFGRAPATPWSDMNGYGAALLPHLAYKLYWSIFATIPLMIALALWVRGRVPGLGARLARLRRVPWLMRALAAATCLWLAYAGFLYLQDRGIESFQTRHQRLARAAELEHRYGAYRDTPSLSVGEADYQIDLQAAAGVVAMSGRYSLVNRHGRALDRILVQANPVLRFQQLEPEGAYQTEVHAPELGFYVFKLAAPLAPGARTELAFAYRYRRPRLPAAIESHQLYRNGTFLERDFFPLTGFPSERLLKRERDRRRFQLPPLVLPPAPETAGARGRSGLGGDTTWSQMRALVRTDLDQIALFPAPLIERQHEGGRSVARFDSGSTRLLFWPTLVSARYQLKREQHHQVSLEIYHHPGHDRNLEAMMRAMKRALDYCEQHFGPYPLHALRILEFPRHHRYAQSLSGTIPFSESLGFIAESDPRDPDRTDFPFFATAHEVAHQWWPHQAMPADAQGADLLSETLAQYTALRVLRQELGQDRMRPMLELQRHLYLKQRTELDHEEPTLTHLTDETFLAYHKGGLGLYALAEQIGEQRVNAALRRYLDQFRQRDDRFALSTDLVAGLREVTPTAQRHLIHDLFEQVSFHELALVQARSIGPDELELEIRARKLCLKGMAEEQEQPWDGSICIALLDDRGKILSRQRVSVSDRKQQYRIRDKAAARAVLLDPDVEKFDRVLEDNQCRIVRPALARGLKRVQGR